MRYLIGSISLCVFVILALSSVYCGYRAITDEITWGFVMLGLTLPTALSLLITQAAFQAASEY